MTTNIQEDWRDYEGTTEPETFHIEMSDDAAEMLSIERLVEIRTTHDAVYVTCTDLDGVKFCIPDEPGEPSLQRLAVQMAKKDPQAYVEHLLLGTL